MPALSQILISLITAIIFIPINALILLAVTKLFKLANSRFLTALKTAAVAGAILFAIQQIIGVFSEALLMPTAGVGMLLGIGGLVFLITIILTVLVNSYAVKVFYKEKTSKAFLVGIAWAIVNLILAMIIGAIMVAIAIAIVIGTGGLA